MLRLLSLWFGLTLLTSSAVAVETTRIVRTRTDCSQALSQLERQNQRDKAQSVQSIRLASWNIEKAQHQQLAADLRSLTAENDYVVLQEAVDEPWLRQLKPYALFAPGFATGTTRTGVMILGNQPMLFSCLFQHREPWLRTPKASAITAIPLAADRYFVIVNVHAINFALGMSDYKQQLNDLFSMLTNYQGPLILAGDFNTWKQSRTEWLNTQTSLQGMQKVSFKQDFRSQIFGYHLDHIFVRGLKLSASHTQHKDSSDHNPMVVTVTTE